MTAPRAGVLAGSVHRRPPRMTSERRLRLLSLKGLLERLHVRAGGRLSLPRQVDIGQAESRVAARRPKFLCSRAKGLMPRGIIPNLDAPGHQSTVFYSAAFTHCATRVLRVGRCLSDPVVLRAIMPWASFQSVPLSDYSCVAQRQNSSRSARVAIRRRP